MWLRSLSETTQIIIGAIFLVVMIVAYVEKRRIRRLDSADRFARHIAPKLPSESPAETPNVDPRLPAILQAARRESMRTTDPAQRLRFRRRRVIFELVRLAMALLLGYVLLSLFFGW